MRENKLIGRETLYGIERSLTLAIRRAGAVEDSDELLRLAQQVHSLMDTATHSKDHELADSVGRLLAELQSAANGGPKHYRPVLEYKDCAASLQHMDRFEVRRATRAAMQVTGFASTFGGPPDSYGDIIERGAFAKSLARHRAAGTLPKLFWSHDSSQVPGMWKDVREDATGLVADGRLAKTTLGLDLNELIVMGAVDALSIGFVIPPKGARFDSNGVRIISEIDLHEVSLVSLPANPRARLTSSAPSPVTDAYDGIQQNLRDLRETLAREPLRRREDSAVLDFPKRTDDVAALRAMQALADRITTTSKRISK